MNEQAAEVSPISKARIAGVFYLLNILTGASALFSTGSLGIAVNLLATACYVAVTVLFYALFKPVNASLNLLAAAFSLVGCALSVLNVLDLVHSPVNPLVFFGFYCVLIGWLVFRSTFLPRILGVLMIFGGLGWLTFLFPPLASSLSPYNMAPGILGETVLTLWLLIKGIDVGKWNEKAIAG